MTMIIVVYGGTLLLARWLIERTGPGGWRTVAIMAATMVAAPVIAFALAVFAGWINPDLMGDHLKAGITHAVLAACIMPLYVLFARRQRLKTKSS